MPDILSGNELMPRRLRRKFRMPRVLAAFLTGAALSAIVSVVCVVHGDVVGARASLKPFNMAAGPSATAGPPVARRSDEKAVASSTQTHLTAPSLTAPPAASASTVRISPSRPPWEISLNPAPLLTPLPPPSDTDSNSAPAITPSSLMSAQPKRPMPAVSRPVPGISAIPAPSRRTPFASAESSSNHKQETARNRSATAKAAAGGRQPAVGSVRFAAPTNARIWDCRAIRSRLQCAQVHSNNPSATAGGLNNLRRSWP
jgi:hypothetical protein